MAENEIITQQDPQMQLFSQLMEGILKKLERYEHFPYGAPAAV